MKRSEFLLKLSANMQKHKSLIDGYAKGSIPLKCLCDNLAIYLIDEIKNAGLLPPPQDNTVPWEAMAFEWEPEEEQDA